MEDGSLIVVYVPVQKVIDVTAIYFGGGDHLTACSDADFDRMEDRVDDDSETGASIKVHDVAVMEDGSLIVVEVSVPTVIDVTDITFVRGDHLTDCSDRIGLVKECLK